MVTILPLTKEHEEKLTALFLDVFAAAPWFDEWSSEEQLASYLKDLTDNSNSLSLGLFDEKGNLIGGSLGYTFNWWQGKEYYIKEFFISRDYQNKGMGSTFLEKMAQLLKEREIVHITLMTDKDVSAYPFYKKNGFTEQTGSAFFFKKIN